jgi:phosphinothricin acetyltransferase
MSPGWTPFAGFRTVDVRERVGRHTAQDNRWRDVSFIERRSPLIH